MCHEHFKGQNTPLFCLWIVCAKYTKICHKHPFEGFFLPFFSRLLLLDKGDTIPEVMHWNSHIFIQSTKHLLFHPCQKIDDPHITFILRPFFLTIYVPPHNVLVRLKCLEKNLNSRIFLFCFYMYFFIWNIMKVYRVGKSFKKRQMF